jgi:hypothetical protein
MVRYADDLVVLCRRGGAQRSMPVLRRSEQLAPAAEQRAQETWDGEHHVAVRDAQQHLLAQPLGPQQLLLLLARGAAAAAAAGEGDEHAPAALATP